MDQKIFEKPLFSLRFFNILTKSFKALGNALGDSLGTPWEGLGHTLGGFGDALESLGSALGNFGDALGGLGDALGGLRDALEGPTRELGRGPAKRLKSIIFWMYVCTRALLLLSSNKCIALPVAQVTWWHPWYGTAPWTGPGTLVWPWHPGLALAPWIGSGTLD